MAKFLSTERKRRTSYRDEAAGQLPWETTFIDVPPPQLEVSTIGGGSDDLSLTVATRQDLEDYFGILARLAQDPELLARLPANRASPLEDLRTTLGRHVAKMDGLATEFEKLVEKTILSAKMSGSKRIGSSFSSPRSSPEER